MTADELLTRLRPRTHRRKAAASRPFFPVSRAAFSAVVTYQALSSCTAFNSARSANSCTAVPSGTFFNLAVTPTFAFSPARPASRMMLVSVSSLSFSRARSAPPWRTRRRPVRRADEGGQGLDGREAISMWSLRMKTEPPT